MNKIILTGNITKDIDLRYTTQTNIPVCNFNIAVNDFDTTEFIKVECWKKQAENVNQYCHKGSKVLVEGRYTTEKYTNKQGLEVTAPKVVALRVEFLDTKHTEKPQQKEKEIPQGNFNNVEDNLPF